MLLFALVGATEMTAQNKVYTLTPGERVTEITAGQQYMIYNSAESGQGYCFFLYNSGSAFAGVKSTNPSTFSITGTEAVVNKYIFTAETGSVDGTFAMKNLASNTYPQGTTTQSTDAVNLHFEEWTASSREKAGVNSYNHDGTTTASASITAENKVWVIYKDGANQSWSNTGNNSQPANWNSGQPFAIYTINKVEETSISIPINFTDTKTGNTFTLADQVVAIGSSVSDAVGTHAFYTINSITDQNGNTIETFAETTTALNVSVTSNFPFELMTITDGAFANANFYTMLIANGSRDVVYEGGTGVTTISNTKGFNKKSLWAFEQVSGTEANFKIYNLAAGATVPMAVNGTGGGTSVGMGTYDGGNASTDQFTLTTSDTGYAFLHTKATTYLNASVSLVDTDADGNLNPNTGLGLWGANGAGSRFTFASVDDMVPAEANAYIGEPDANYTTEDGYAAISTENAILLNYLYLYNYNKSFSALNTALEGIADAPSFDLNKPFNMGLDGSKIYQIISYNDGQVVYADPYKDSEGGVYDRGRNLLTGSVSEDPTAMTAMSAMIITESGANYYIQHANSEYWLCNVNDGGFGGTPDLPYYQSSSTPYVIKPANYKSNVFALKTSTGDNKWLACGGENNTLTVLTEDPTTANEYAGNPAGFWLIKEIKSIPVTISAAKWSTLCLPVAVTVPNDASLKVYTVSGVDNGTGVMTLNEVEAGTVVAKNTGLLLASTSETSEPYNFEVSTEAGTSYEGNNILMGTTARRFGFNTATATDPTAITIPHYALAQKDDVVAFYPSTLNILPANKAYIKKADIPTGGDTNRALYMTGNTTGVDSTLIQNGEAEEYYDLNGRRVLYPTTGIYATRSGKKVFIK